MALNAQDSKLIKMDIFYRQTVLGNAIKQSPNIVIDLRRMDGRTPTSKLLKEFEHRFNDAKSIKRLIVITRLETYMGLKRSREYIIDRNAGRHYCIAEASPLSFASFTTPTSNYRQMNWRVTGSIRKVRRQEKTPLRMSFLVSRGVRVANRKLWIAHFWNVLTSTHPLISNPWFFRKPIDTHRVKRCRYQKMQRFGNIPNNQTLLILVGLLGVFVINWYN